MLWLMHPINFNLIVLHRLLYFSDMYVICELLKLDAWMSQSVTSTNCCQYDTSGQHKLNFS